MSSHNIIIFLKYKKQLKIEINVGVAVMIVMEKYNTRRQLIIPIITINKIYYVLQSSTLIIIHNM